MAGSFASFKFADRIWSDRLLENTSLRKSFVWTLVLVFVLGTRLVIVIDDALSHRSRAGNIISFLALSLLAIAYSRLIYKRLER